MFAEVLRGKPTIHFNNNLEDAQKLTSLAKKYFGTFTVSDNHLSKVNFDWGTKRVDEEPRLLSKISWFFYEVIRHSALLHEYWHNPSLPYSLPAYSYCSHLNSPSQSVLFYVHR